MQAKHSPIQQIEEVMGKSNKTGDDKGINEGKSKEVKNQSAITKENQKNQAKLFAGNKMVAKGMDLRFIAPTIKNGEVMVELCEEKMVEKIVEWMRAP